MPEDFEYLVTPFVAKTHGNQKHESVSDQLQHVLNHYARYGWVFQRLELVNVEHNPGCLAGFFGQTIIYHRHDVLVFRRTKPAPDRQEGSPGVSVGTVVEPA